MNQPRQSFIDFCNGIPNLHLFVPYTVTMPPLDRNLRPIPNWNPPPNNGGRLVCRTICLSQSLTLSTANLIHPQSDRQCNASAACTKGGRGIVENMNARQCFSIFLSFNLDFIIIFSKTGCVNGRWEGLTGKSRDNTFWHA